MYIIQEGKVRIAKKFGTREHILAVLSKGEFFGEMAMVSRIQRTADAVAIGNVKLLSFDREGLSSMIEKNAKIGLSMIEKLCRRLQHANQQIQSLMHNNKKSLIATALYLHFEETGLESQIPEKEVLQGISLDLELPQEHVQTIISEFAEANLISLSEGKIQLLDKDGLLAAS
jgi:CRP/FNR family cyclic AMP-dependent transcriptional regulator